MFGSGMSNEKFNEELEILARLIESTAEDVEQAAQIVRRAKIAAKKKSEHNFSFDSDNLAMPEIHVKDS